MDDGSATFRRELPEDVKERIHANTGVFLLALKAVLGCLILMRFYKLGQAMKLQRAREASAKAKAEAKAAKANAQALPPSAGKADAKPAGGKAD